MKPPSEIIRLTLADELPACAGIYILAYRGKIKYVGQTIKGVSLRMRFHLTDALGEQVGTWMRQVEDRENVRIDILVPPTEGDARAWLHEAEIVCIRKFRPEFNQIYKPQAAAKAVLLACSE